MTKKIIKYSTLTSSIVFSLSLILSAASCGIKQNTIISLVTNNNQLNDNNINQGIYLGAQNFQNSHKNDEGVPKYFTNFIRPKSSKFNDYLQAYKDLEKNNTNTFILSGSEQSRLGKIDDFAKKHSSKNFLLIGENEHSNAPSNLYTISYDYLQSGFMAAIYLGLYYELNTKTPNPIKVAMFGREIKLDSINYMDGFRLGVEYFNKKYGSSKTLITISYANKKTPSIGDFIYSSDWKEENLKVKKYVDDKLADQVDVFYSINEPQLEEVTNIINKSGKSTKVIGNINNLSQKSLANKKIIIGSTIINYEAVISQNLNNIYGFSNSKIKSKKYTYSNNTKSTKYLDFTSGSDAKGKQVINGNEWLKILESAEFQALEKLDRASSGFIELL